jgi:hypothetical protein
MIELNDEVMREAKKSLKEKGIKAKDVKNLPPIEELCKPIPHSSTIEVHSLQRFDERDILYSKPPDQCLDEFDNFIVKQENFNRMVHWLLNFSLKSWQIECRKLLFLQSIRINMDLLKAEQFMIVWPGHLSIFTSAKNLRRRLLLLNLILRKHLTKWNTMLSFLC